MPLRWDAVWPRMLALTQCCLTRTFAFFYHLTHAFSPSGGWYFCCVANQPVPVWRPSSNFGHRRLFSAICSSTVCHPSTCPSSSSPRHSYQIPANPFMAPAASSAQAPYLAPRLARIVSHADRIQEVLILPNRRRYCHKHNARVFSVPMLHRGHSRDLFSFAAVSTQGLMHACSCRCALAASSPPLHL